jgi:hypothetical protein
MFFYPDWLDSLRQGHVARRNIVSFAACAVLAVLPACAETGPADELDLGIGQQEASVPSTTTDASLPSTTQDTGVPWSTYDAGAIVMVDAGTPATDAGGSRDSSTPAMDSGAKKDGGNPLDDLIGEFFKDSGAPNADASFTPPPEGGGEWKLNPGSFVDCPKEPPPIPLIGGLCAGIYYGCGWTNTKGDQYSCICDWVHWLCI